MARSELAIATMSTTSCSSAPKIAGMMPKAAMSISTIDSAMPTQIDSLATRRVRRPTDTATAAREMSSRTITTSAVSEAAVEPDRKSTRLNSSHVAISYAVFCLKKKRKDNTELIEDTVVRLECVVYKQ